MPVLYAPPVVETPPPAPVVIPPRQLLGADVSSVEYVAPDGSSWPLTSPELGWFLQELQGINSAVPRTMTTDPEQTGGTRVRHIQYGPRLVTATLHVYGQDHTEFLERWWTLGDALLRSALDTPGSAAGLLVVARPDGTRRELTVRYQEGWEDTPRGGHLAEDAAVILYAEDGFWRDVDPTEVRAEDAPARSFLAPYPSLSSGQVIGRRRITNPGAATAWPLWTITGPATRITATLLTTGESWSLDPSAPGIDNPGPLLAGETITITTGRDPSVAGPQRASATEPEEWAGALDWPGAVLWGIPRGSHEVEFLVEGRAAGTSLTLVWQNRRETA